MEKIKNSLIDEVRGFFDERPGLKLSQICKEADVSYQQLWSILNRETKSMTTHVYESLMPVMKKYGFGYQKEEL